MTNKIEAIIEICRELHNEKPSPTSFKRSIKAAQALGLTKDETLSLLSRLEFCDGDGKPYHTAYCDLLAKFIATPDPNLKPMAAFNATTLANLMRALKADNRIGAIKQIRTMLGLGLREGLDFFNANFREFH